MHERTNIRLTAADRSALEAVVANRNSSQKHVWRAKIVLLTADGHGTAEIMHLYVGIDDAHLAVRTKCRRWGGRTVPLTTLREEPASVE